MNPPGAEKALVLGRDLRRLGVRAEVDGRGGKLKAMLRRADAQGARLCVLIGESEIERGIFTVKDLGAHTQEELPMADAARIIADRLAHALATGAR